MPAERNKICGVTVIPEAENISYIFDELKKAPDYEEYHAKDNTDLTVDDIVESAVLQFELEIEAGIKLIKECRAMEPMILSSLDEKEEWRKPILTLRVYDNEASVNRFVEAVREKYWGYLFKNPKFTSGMTSEMQRTYLGKVHELSKYDFNKYNIKTVQIEMRRHMVEWLEKCIIDLFDDFTYRYSTENAENIHYFNGWRTNKAWICRKKIIIPLYRLYSDICQKFDYCWEASQKLSDIEKVFNYLAGHMSGSTSLHYILRNAEDKQESRNIEFKYFTCNFYKKGTCHITFKDDELLKKFNIFGSQHKGWLPPAYGKKGYDDLDDEERSVIDSFEGEEAYREVCSNPDKYIFEPDVALLEMSA